MGLIIFLVNIAFNVASFIIIAQVALQWLAIFGVVNTNNEQASRLIAGLDKLTEPVYSKIRKYVPAVGGIDLTPLVALVGLAFLEFLIMGVLT